jgi:glutaredoxin
LSDFYPHGLVAARYSVLRQEGYSERAIFIIDKQGIVRYVDVHDIDLQPDNEELFRVLALIEPAQMARSSAVTAAAVPSKAETPYTRPDADVVIYCTPWCPECRRVRAFLNENGIQYVEVDISKDRAAAQRVRSYANGNETTPTFDIKGTIVVSFDRPRIASLLGIPYP